MAAGRIVVTGATGFIGRHVVERLARDGRVLTLTVRDPQVCPDVWRQNANIAIIAVPDLTRADALMPALDDATTVVHLAGLAHMAQADAADAEAQFSRANVETTRALADAASQAGVSAFVNLSSLAAITSNATDATIDDRSEAPPDTAYGRSKRAAEAHVADMAAAGAFAVSLRPPLVVGPEAGGNWALLQRLAASGMPLPFASIANRRSFVGVGTLCEAISALISQKPDPRLSGSYCIADEETLSLPDVVGELRRGMGMSPRMFGCPPAVFAALGQLTGRRRQFAGLTGNLRVDASRFLSTFGFKPATPIRDAIRESGAGYLAARRKTPSSASA